MFKELLIYFICMVLVMIAIVFGFAMIVDAHETGQYKHFEKGVIGPDIIYVVRCNQENTWLFFVDTNGDRIHDECYYVWREHNEIHYMPRMAGECMCWEDE